MPGPRIVYVKLKRLGGFCSRVWLDKKADKKGNQEFFDVSDPWGELESSNSWGELDVNNPWGGLGVSHGPSITYGEGINKEVKDREV